MPPSALAAVLLVLAMATMPTVSGLVPTLVVVGIIEWWIRPTWLKPRMTRLETIR
jgi:hypothetical protein